MNRYSILLSTELLDEKAYSSVLDALCERCKRLQNSQPVICLSDPGNHFITIISPVQELQENKSASQDDLWTEMTLEYQNGDILHHQVPVTEFQTECPNKMLVNRIHQIAENLPKIGVFLDVFWLIQDEVLPPTSDNIELYGACKRLLEWNNADFKFVALTSEVVDDERAEPWMTLLRGHLITCDQISNVQSDILWRGKVEITGSNLRKPVHLPGFELRSPTQKRPMENEDLDKMLHAIGVHDPDKQPTNKQTTNDVVLPHLLSNKLEIIAQLDRQEIPLLYYTGNYCHLCITSESKLVDKSRQFIQQLTDNQRLCYIVRLQYGTSWKNTKDDICYKNKETKEKKMWSDFVQENIEHVLYCPMMPDLDGELGQLVMLLCAGHQTLQQPLSDDISCQAHMLRLPKDFNGNFTHQMAVAELWKSEASKEEAERNKMLADTILSGLPRLTGSCLLHLKHCIKNAQISALRRWIDEQISLGKPIYISKVDLISLLQAAYTKMVEQFIYFYQNSESTEVGDGNDDDEENCDTSSDERASKGSGASVKQIERLILEYQNQTETISNDSLAGLCPPSRDQVVSLNAAEFLKFFKEDGTPAVDCPTQVTLQKSSSFKRLMKLSFDELKTITWPECESLQFHDIYYSNGVTEVAEQQSRRLLSRFLTTETSSTCIYRQAHNPAILTLATLPKGHQHDDLGEDEVKVNQERIARSAAKCKNVQRLSTKDAKRIYAAKKGIQSTVKSHVTADKKCSDNKAAEKAKSRSRSQRHKRKLEEIVKETLKKHGVMKDDPLFKACALRLYNITKSFVKDLTSSVGLREEMERIAQSNVQMIVDFERKNRQQTQK